MKFVLLLTFFAGLSTVAWAKCQQDSKCEGVCHPVAPDNSKGWYSTTICRSGCKCWRKKECDIQHKKCSILNGTLGCVYGKPPSFSNLQAVFACDRCDPECNCWVKKSCEPNDKCKALDGICSQKPPGKGWVNKFYCDWYTDCQCWVKEPGCPGTCKQKGEQCQVDSPGETWTMTGELCGSNGCKCWSQCYDTACARQRGKCSPQSPGWEFKPISKCKGNCRCWRECYDQKCFAMGGKCHETQPGKNYTRIGKCKGKCSCWRPNIKPNDDEIKFEIIE